MANVFEFACPACGAEKGAFCVLPDGTRTSAHVPRLRLSQGKKPRVTQTKMVQRGARKNAEKVVIGGVRATRSEHAASLGVSRYAVSRMIAEGKSEG